MAVGAYALTTLQRVKDWLNETGSTNDTALERLIDAATARIERYCGREFVARDRVEFHDGNVRTLRLRHYPVNSCRYVGYGRQPVLSVKSSVTTDVSATVQVTTASPYVANNAIVLTRIAADGTTETQTVLIASYATASLIADEINTLSNWEATMIVDVPTKYLHRMGPIDTVDGAAELTSPSHRSTTFRVDSMAGTIAFPVGWCDVDWDDIEEEWDGESQVVVVDYNGGYATVPDDVQQATVELVAAAYHARFNDANVDSESIGDYSYTSAVRDAGKDILTNLLAGWKEIR